MTDTQTHTQCKYWTGAFMEYANYECSFANSLVNCLTKNLHIIRVCVCTSVNEFVFSYAACIRVTAKRREIQLNGIKNEKKKKDRFPFRLVECHLNICTSIHTERFSEAQKREQA